MFNFRKPARTLALIVSCTALLGACQEQLEGGAACPVLCPEQVLEVRDTLIHPVALDTTLIGFPPFATEAEMLVTRRGDTLVTAAVLRFDTLQTRVRTAADTAGLPIAVVDSAFLSVTLGQGSRAGDTVVVQVYDVTGPGGGVDTAAIRQRFTDPNLIATREVPQDSITGRIQVQIPPSLVQQAVQGTAELTFGLTARSDTAFALRVLSREADAAATLTYRVRTRADQPTDSATTLSVPVNIVIRPPGSPFVPELSDYMLVVRSTAAPIPPLTFGVGGLPAARAYLRFNVPTRLLDSATVVRAALILTQRPNLSLPAADTIRVLPRVVLASPILSPGRSALLLGDPGLFGIPPQTVRPTTGGQVTFEIAGALRAWAASTPTAAPIQRAIVLQALDESFIPARAFFYSTEAPLDLQPVLRVFYIPRTEFGLP